MVNVVARLKPFSQALTSVVVPHGSTVADILASLGVPPSVSAYVTVDGVVIDDYQDAIPWEGSTVNISILPRFGGGMKQFGKLALGAGSLALLMLLSRKSSTAKNAQSFSNTSSQNNAAAPLPEPYEPPPTSVQYYGGPASVQISAITGIQNKSNQYGPFPRGYGRRKMFPVVVGNPYTVIQGSEQYLYVVLSAGYGELDITDTRVGEKPIADFLPADLTYEIKYGLLADTPVALYTNDVEEEQLSQPLLSMQWFQKIVPQVCDNISFDISFPSGLFTSVPPNPTLIAVSIGFSVEYRKVGDVPWIHVGATPTFFHTDATTGLSRVNYNFNVARDQYEIRVQRTTVDTQNDSVAATASDLTAVRGILFQAPTKVIRDINNAPIPMTYIALKVRATDKTNGVINEVSCVAQSKLPYYDGAIWQAPVITRNPAWIFADIVTGSAFGRQLDYTILDANALLDWANFCTASGFFFDYVYDSQTTLQEALKDVCAAGRATLNVVDGRITVVPDKTRTTLVQHFSQANTSGLRVHRIYPIIPHAIRVKFINPDALWQTDERVVFDDGYNESNAVRYETIEPLGLTDKNQAFKMGRYYLATARLRPKTYEFDVDIQHIVCNRGDLIRLTHDVALHGIGASLIKSVITNGGGDITAIVLEQFMPMADPGAYQARVRLRDGSSTLVNIVAFNGETDTLTLVTPILFATNPKPERGNLLLFGNAGSESVELIITAIDHNFETMMAHITAVPYAPSVFTADTGVIPQFNSQVQAPILVNQPLEIPVLAP